ncbi:hypothetical protein ACHAPY_003814 [Fusarium culmorum]
MAPVAADKKTEKSYLSSAVDSINPWAASRSTTPIQKPKAEPDSLLAAAPANPDDHSTTHLYGQSFRTYPPGCPPLKVQWFHAVDVPKRKPKLSRSTEPEQVSTLPKKFNAFSTSDSRALEAEYQKLLEKTESTRSQALGSTNVATRKRKAEVTGDATGDISDQAAGIPCSQSTGTRVPVNEDFLFDVDIESRELAPVYWLGPVYSEGMLSWVASSMYQRFSGGSYMSGVKLVRGYSEPSKNKEKDAEKDKSDENKSETGEDVLPMDEKQQKVLKRRSAPPSTRASQEEPTQEGVKNSPSQDPRQSTLQRQLSSLLESEGKTKAEKEEEIRRRQEQEIQDDYNAQAGETQGREIEHLVLVTHGIGQLLSLRMESINFVHDVNVLRKTIKSVYANSADLKALNSELGAGPDFPKKREKKGERDLGDLDGDEDEYPSLEDITIEGVAFARSLISDLALDVLLYQSSYRAQISKIVLNECNRIFKLFRERNPEFRGKVHLMGHSLGSAILFDLLCQQRRDQAPVSRSILRLWPAQDIPETPSKDSDLNLEFKVEDFFCIGSPIGLFQMLKGQTIAARQNIPAGNAINDTGASTSDDILRPAPLALGSGQISSVTGLPASVASPKVQQLFNIFHPSDPISYRLEPLISPSMSTLKPQLLPYTKRGIFGNVAPQGLTGIGAKVGQSVSGLWSSLSAGIASNLLNRSLGLSSEEVARLTANASQGDNADAAGTKLATNRDVSSAAEKLEATDARMKKLADSATGNVGFDLNNGDRNPTLIDDEIETLYSSFQKSRQRPTKDEDNATTAAAAAAAAAADEDKKARKMRNEEAKVRALNRNGRVDYSIQESVLDFNPINTIASHMAYWGDEDVNHFVLSQLLSSRSSFKSNPGDSTTKEST